jgi:hypothetical protein
LKNAYDIYENFVATYLLSYITVVKVIRFPQGENNSSETLKYVCGNKARRNMEKSVRKWKTKGIF